MKHDSRGVIRIGDKTTHGGEVISASSGTVVMGKLAALDGICPFARNAKANSHCVRMGQVPDMKENFMRTTMT